MINITTDQLTTRCLDAAADLDDDESASPTELAAIAATIAFRIAPDHDAEPILDQIAYLTLTAKTDIIALLDQ